MEERDYGYFLANLEGFSPLLLRRLLSLYGSPEQVFKQASLPVTPGQMKAFLKAKDLFEADLKARDAWEARGVHWCWYQETAYPRRLKDLADSPLGLFWKGRLPPDTVPSVGIVGARNCSVYGRSMAERFGGELGGQGIAVVSGMARGIDGYAQAAAIRRGGRSYAVLGCGADICYPSSNRALYEALEADGGIISEYKPGTEPLAYHFPMRNRLIAALSDVLLVLEARDKSGTFITVDQALEQGKEVLALPGRVDDMLSAGCLKLIRQGAGLLTSCGDVLELLGVKEKTAPHAAREALSPELMQLWQSLSGEPKHLEVLMAEREISLGVLSLQLLELENKGYVRSLPGGCFVQT